MANELEEIWPDLVRFSRRLTGDSQLADDLAQESMARALQTENGLSGVANPRAWLCRIALNVFREWWRKRNRETKNFQQFAATVGEGTISLPHIAAQHRERSEQVWTFIQSLPEIQRQVIRLHVVEGFSHTEIAQRLNTTNDSVKSNLSLVRRKLRDKFLKN